MLQTIRDYATAQLDLDPDGAAAVRRAHADHYTQLAVDLRSMLGGRDREEVLGSLAAELGNFRAAWSHWVAAGDVVNLNALLEPLWGYYDARGQYGAAIELANDMLAVLRIQPETVERVRDEIALEMSLARSLLTVRGYTAEVERTVMAAVDRARESGDAHLQFPVLRSLATLHLMRSDYISGAEVGRELLELAEQQREPMLLSDAHLVVGVNTAFQERLADGVDHLDRSIAHFDEAAAGLVQFRVGPSPGVVAHMVSGLMLWMLGFPDRAAGRVGRGIEVAEELGHPYSLAYGVFHAAVLDVFRKDLPSVHRQGDRLLQIANANDYGIWRALAFVLRGMARVGGGDAEGGLTELERGFALYGGMKTPPVFWPLLQMLRAFAYAMAGRVDDALGFLAEGRANLPEGDFQAADFDLAHAEMLLATGTADPEEVRALCEASLDLAERAGSRMTEVQAATHLVRLHAGGPGESAARDRLRAILDGFTEGYDLAPLVAARAALDG
jgi:tetratricopeptide (TPR) repeat protein